jgi:hypothetical protein
VIAALLALLLAGSASATAVQDTRPASRPATRPARTPEAAVAKAIEYLLATQNKDGSYGTFRTSRDYEILASVPGSHEAFRGATTALCAMALMDVEPAWPEVAPARRRALDFVTKRSRVGRPNGLELYNVWSFAYGLRALARGLRSETDPDRIAAMRESANELVRALETYQTLDGGWGYYDFNAQTYRPSGSSTSFTTATALISLHEAADAGISCPPKVIERALLTVRRARREDGAYLYSDDLKYMPVFLINRPKGSSCRMQVCNLALNLFGAGAVTPDDIKEGVQVLLDTHRFVDVARKRPIPHEAWYLNSGYFFYYGHYYAALALQRLRPADREHLAQALQQIILERQEPDGSWWDFPMYGYHKAYGTAFALMTLRLCNQ